MSSGKVYFYEKIVNEEGLRCSITHLKYYVLSHLLVQYLGTAEFAAGYKLVLSVFNILVWGFYKSVGRFLGFGLGHDGVFFFFTVSR